MRAPPTDGGGIVSTLSTLVILVLLPLLLRLPPLPPSSTPGAPLLAGGLAEAQREHKREGDEQDALKK